MKRSDIDEELRNFDRLPAAAFIRLPVVASLFEVSESTVWRWCRIGKLPHPAYLGGVPLWSVGELREAINSALQSHGRSGHADQAG